MYSAESSPAGVEKPLRVLMVEDDPGDVKLVRLLLLESTHMYEVEAVGCISAAIKRLHNGVFDVVLLDMGLPDSGGIDTISKAHAECPDIPIVVLTGLDDEEIGIRAVRTGAQDYLVKGNITCNLLMRTISYAIERKRAEEEIQIQRARFESIFERSLEGIVTLDMNNNVLETNTGFENIYGYKREETMGKRLDDLIVPERFYYGEAKELDKMALDGILGYETIRKRKDGTEISVSLSAGPIKIGEEVRGRFVIFCDITERKWAEDRIEHLNKVLQAIRNVNQLIAREKDRDQLIKGACDNLIETRGYCNAWLAILDESGGLITAAEAGLDKDFLPMVEQLKRGKLTACAQRALMQSAVVVTEAPSLTCTDCPLVDKYANRAAMTVRLEHEGKVYGILSVSVVRTLSADEEEQALFEEIANDIAFALHNIELAEERKRMEQERRELEHKAQVASRLASIGELAAGVAHEINNPLTGVIGFAQLIMQKDIPDDIRGDLNIINEGAQRVASIVKRLLTFARWQKPEREYVDINQVIEATLAMRAYEMETANIKVATQLAPDLRRTMADRGQLQQVFLNIIINAEMEMRLAHDGGNLLIKTETEDNTIRISFKDDGPGIAEENLERIFNPFFTTREVGNGTGLGLSLCLGIITEHKGQIYAESRLGEGSTFIVELPVVVEDKQLEMPEPIAEEATGAKILVVDDELAILQFLERVLTDEGHEVETVDNADDALERIENKRYRLILMDIKMPGMGGIELYKRIQKIAHSLTRRVVFITGDVMGGDTKEFLAKVKAHYITKPFDTEQIKRDINRILTQGEQG
jgi:PAS domain S-box-containing protein